MPGPVGQERVSASPLVVSAFRRRKEGHHEQSFDVYRSRHWRRHHKTQPARSTRFDEMAMARADWITIDFARPDLTSTALLDRIVDPYDHQLTRFEGNYPRDG